MKQARLFLCGLLLAALASCSQNNEGAKEEGHVAVGFSALVGTLQDKSGNMLKSVTSSWYSGAQIGITMVETGTDIIAESADNKPYTYTSGSSFSTSAANTIYYPVDGSQVDFIAYHPYNSSVASLGMLTIDVSDQSDQNALDLLFAKTTGKDKNVPNVNLGFEHSMSRITMTIAPGNGLTPADLQNLKVELRGMNTRAQFSTANGSLSNQNTPATITIKTSANGTSSEGIILPAAGGTYSFVFTLDGTGEPFVWDVPAGKEFKVGEENKYNATITRTQINITSSVSEWLLGNGNGEDASAE